LSAVLLVPLLAPQVPLLVPVVQLVLVLAPLLALVAGRAPRHHLRGHRAMVGWGKAGVCLVGMV
jgi:hypothetical protein